MAFDESIDTLRDLVLERASLRDQYFLFREERAKIKWIEKNTKLILVLNNIKSRIEGETDSEILRQIEQNSSEIANVFERLVAIPTVFTQESGEQTKTRQEFEKRLMSQLLVKVAVIQDRLNVLQENSERRVTDAFHYLIGVAAGFVAVLSLMTAFTLIFIVKLISRRLEALHLGARIVAEGDLDFRLDEAGADELTEVAESINLITGKLQLYTKELENDLIERKQNEMRLLLAGKVFANSGEAIMITDADARILSVNPAFSLITGYSREEVIGESTRLLRSGRHDAAFYDSLWASLNERNQWQGEIWNRRKSGEFYPEWLTIAAIRDAEGAITNYVASFSDITEHKRAQDRIEFLAFHDPLTRLPNRVLGRDRVGQAIAYAERMKTKMAALFLDLDKFKLVNDTLGHAVGDALLQAVAGRLQGCLRETDTLCRLAGDEFLIVLQDTRDNEAVSIICEKILALLVKPFALEGQSLTTSFSIGIAVYPEDGRNTDELLRSADTAMYEAKEAGRNTYRFFDRRMNADVSRSLHLREEMRQALSRGEFELYYQPQIDLESGDVIGVEALVRWNHPERGLVFPGDFIAIAEDSGLIVPIGEWVLLEACRQAKLWLLDGISSCVVAVNLSGAQFTRGTLVETVSRALQESGLPPELLELELTESILIQDAEGVLAIVRQLKSFGVKLSIDDFGTGYSSLSYLKRFNVDKLKIDQSFVRDIASDPDDKAIVNAIIQMARSLGLTTIAEGVENADALALLTELGCDEVQGYYFARPMNRASLSAYLSAAAAAREAR